MMLSAFVYLKTKSIFVVSNRDQSPNVHFAVDPRRFLRSGGGYPDINSESVGVGVAATDRKCGHPASEVTLACLTQRRGWCLQITTRAPL